MRAERCQVLLPRALILHFWETLLSQSRLSLSPAQTVRQPPTTCSTIFSPIMATRPLPTALAAIFPAALQARLQRTPRGRVRQRLSLRLWSLTSSLDLAFSLTCSLIFCPLLICSAIRSLVVQLQTTCLTLWIRAFLLQLI